jgi:acetyl esterase/lipase
VNLTFFTLTLILAADADKHPVLTLWPDGAPGAVGKEDADIPTLTVFLPPADKATGAACIICPGGGYGGLASSYEGNEPAEFLTKLGVASFVLKYRLAPRYRHPAPIQDAQRAIRTVRAKAKDYGIDPTKIGIWGFSAGGHLASTAGTHFDDGNADAKDPIEKAGCRPDFLILSYPVITFTDAVTHRGSRDNLLGKNPDEKLIENLSNEKQVTAKTPPAFLFHTSEDPVVPAENSVLFYLALKKAKVPAELHIYEKGRHGVGLAVKEEALSSWPGRLTDWLKGRGLLETDKKE